MADSLVNELSTGIVILDDDIRVQFMNTAAEDLLGISRRRAETKHLNKLAPTFGELTELCGRALAENKSFGRELAIPTPQRDGSELELAMRVSPLQDGAKSGLLVEMFDITQRQQLDKENKLATQHGVSRRMIQQLAHEIRNPLGGLRGAAQLLERELQLPELQEFTQVIIREADRLASLMDGLLGPGNQPSKRRLNVHELLEHVATIAESESPRLHVGRDYDPSLPDLSLDRDQMTQALLNIVRNASQATDGRGHIVLRTRILTNAILNQKQHKLVACIEVQDNGPGVPDEIAETLFYPLVTSKEAGTGLGLPLSQDLVKRHGGMIEYDSVPGHTVFTIQVPLTVESS